MTLPRLLAVLLLLSPPAAAFPHGGGPLPAAIGGAAVGARGVTGTIYQGYTLAGGDNMGTALDVVSAQAPLGRYFPTRGYAPGARTGVSGGSSLTQQYDTDPYFTGAQDSNRGVAVGSTNMTQAGSVLTLQSRVASAGEAPYIAGRSYVAAMIHTGGYVTASPPAIIEAYVKLPAGTMPAGLHTTFWLLNAAPIGDGNTSQGDTATNALEFDFEADTYDGTAPANISNNLFVHGSVSGWPAAGGYHTNTEGLFDGQWHLQTFVLGPTSVGMYVDNILRATYAYNPAAPGKPYYALFTNHVINPTASAGWTALGSTGVPMQVAYYRIWVPTAGFPANVYAPKQTLPTAQFPYNTSISYAFPSAASLWGAGVADYCQAIKFQDFSPGLTVEGSANYPSPNYQFPAGYTYAGRTLTGVTTDLQPGRVHTACTPNVTGGSEGYVARGYFDIGPVVTTSGLTATHGVAFDYDVYPDANVGDLVPKALSVTGLPAGLSFSPSTGHITGTPTTAGTYTVTAGVTNSSGQTASKSVTLTVN